MSGYSMDGVIIPTFQPVIDLRSGVPLYYEALARSTVKKSHHELLRFAEGYGFIQLIDAAMIAAAAKTLSRWPDIRVGVNVSVSTIERYCAATVCALFNHLPLAPRFVIEITETMPITDPKMIHTFVDAVKATGAMVAMDDLGDGCFTLADVVEYKPNIVKLAGVMLSERKQRRAEIDAIVSFATNHGIHVVAEVVETEEEQHACLEMGVGFAQGYFLGRVCQQPEVLPSHGVVNYGFRAAERRA
ncbi:MAG: EAL domain-containing protein [Lysobacter sp.]